MLPDSTQIVLEEVPGSFHDYTRLQSKKTLMYHIHLLEWMVWVLVPNGYGKSLDILFKIFFYLLETWTMKIQKIVLKKQENPFRMIVLTCGFNSFESIHFSPFADFIKFNKAKEHLSSTSKKQCSYVTPKWRVNSFKNNAICICRKNFKISLHPSCHAWRRIQNWCIFSNSLKKIQKLHQLPIYTSNQSKIKIIKFSP